MIITLVITAVIDSVFLCGAIDADAQFLPQFFFRIVFNEADSLVFTICLHEVNVDAGVFVLRAYFDLDYRAIWHDKSEMCIRDRGYTPVAPHLIYPQILDDTIPAQRELGLTLGYHLLAACSEMWVCGERISDGMAKEIHHAERLGINIRYIRKIEES